MSRNTLHRNQLDRFRTFCESRGWRNEFIKGTYEVLRMRHDNFAEPLLVYERYSGTEHLTTRGVAEQLTRDFINNKRNTEREFT